jgi:hypothetical protein
LVSAIKQDKVAAARTVCSIARGISEAMIR